MKFQDEIQKLIDEYYPEKPVDDPGHPYDTIDLYDEKQHFRYKLTKDILAVIQKWAIEQRAKYDAIREKSKIDDPKNTQNLIVLGAKAKAFQQVIDKCQFRE